MNKSSVSRFKGLLKVMDIIYLIGVVMAAVGTVVLSGTDDIYLYFIRRNFEQVSAGR